MLYLHECRGLYTSLLACAIINYVYAWFHVILFFHFFQIVNIIKLIYSTVTTVTTGPWRPLIDMATDPRPFITSSMVKIGPKMWPRTCNNHKFIQKLPNHDSCDHRTVTPINRYGHWTKPNYHDKFGEDPT